jgi:hypothetical protein
MSPSLNLDLYIVMKGIDHRRIELIEWGFSLRNT